MNEAMSTRLYNLLPELYRWRDEQQGRPLQAFLAILETELQTLEVDMEAMYDNWFIQTCDNWVVPYLADLLGIRDQIVQLDYLPFTQRRRVANTLAYRRRKGTVAVLEQVLWDVTNWHVRAVEFYRLLNTTQHLQYLQADQVASVHLSDMTALAALESPFSQLRRSGDVRMARSSSGQCEIDFALPTIPAIAEQSGHTASKRTTGSKYNPHTLGLFFWRLRPYPVNRGFPKAHAEANAYFTFSPSGHDTQLFNRPQSFQALVQRATEVNMPVLVTRAELAADLSRYRKQYKDEMQPLSSTYYGDNRSFKITNISERRLFEMGSTPIFLTELNKHTFSNELRQQFEDKNVLLSQKLNVRPLVQDKHWQIDDLEQGKSYRVSENSNLLHIFLTQEQIVPSNLLSIDLRGWPSIETLRANFIGEGVDTNTDLVAVDPELGRIAFLKPETPGNKRNIRVDYTYGFSGDVGGGPYPRHFAVAKSWDSYCEILVATGCRNSEIKDVTKDSKVLVADSVSYALILWNHYCEHVVGKPRALIHILDNGIYEMGLPANHGETETAIRLPEGAELAIVAEDGVQPTLVGDRAQLTISFQPPVRTQPTARAAIFAQDDLTFEEAPIVDRKLHLSGLRIVGELLVEKVGSETINALDLVVEHCTISNGGVAVELEPKNAPALHLTIQRSIVGSVYVPANLAGLSISDSILDKQLATKSATSERGDYALNVDSQLATQPPLLVKIKQCTVFGVVLIKGLLQADAVLFNEPVRIEHADQDLHSLLRYCYVPKDSKIPACEQCLHEDEVCTNRSKCRSNISRPVFSSRRYGRPGYAQLSHLSAHEILSGVGNIAEIGVFSHLYQPQREANIQIMLEEFLPLGLEAGVFHVT